MHILQTIKEKLGPGLVYAGVAVGVSHLVQSTTAGARFGLVMMGYLALVCLVKYPTFLFGARYTSVTGKTLVDGYEEKGRWIVMLYFLLQLFEYTFAISAVAITTVGLVKGVFDIGMADVPLALLLITACIAILSIGKYPVLEDITKVLVISFTVVTVIVALIALIGIDTGGAALSGTVNLQDTPTLLFLVAAAGWMPTGTVGAVGLSLWVKAKEQRLGRRVTLSEANFDFNVGYGASIFTAMCFVILGTYVLYINQVPLETSGAGFATQFMGLFTQVIGDWLYPLIAMAAITVMASTLLTLVDLLPRTSSAIVMRLAPTLVPKENRLYVGFIVVELLLVSAVLLTLMQSFNTFINLMTSMGFVVAPIISILNHWVMFSDKVPREQQPGPVLKAWSWAGIVILSAVTLLYLYLTFFA
jgi:Mn2+/Fe2+ NRAMP family transporter